MTVAAANIFGILALLFWSMNVAVTRHLGEAHPFGMPGLSFLLSGLVVLGIDRLRGGCAPWKSDANRRFWVFGGTSFVVYLLLYTGGLVRGTSREVVLPLGLVNYFWPSLILVLLPFFFNRRVNRTILSLGMALSLAGVTASFLWGFSLSELWGVLRDNLTALGMMLGAAFLWAFYSNAARLWGGTANGVGWFQLTGGLCFCAVWLFSGEPLGFEKNMLLPFLAHAVIVNALAYMFWDFGVRFGDIGLMGTLANFLPLGSVAFGVWYFGEGGTPGLWVGGVLVTVGAVLCRYGLRQEE